MKPLKNLIDLDFINSFFYLFLVSVLISFSSCSPMANSLLVNFKNASGTDNSSTSDNSSLDIQASNSNLVANIDQGDQIEITGSCRDLGRKENKILFEVFAGTDETADPYISNMNSNLCYQSTRPISNTLHTGLESVFISPRSLVIAASGTYTFTSSGGTSPYTYSIISGGGVINPATGVFAAPATNDIVIIQSMDAAGEASRSVVTVLTGAITTVANAENKKCFSVTKGSGLIQNSGLPDEKIYPQCVNGQFGFSVRLGKALLNAGQANSKYFVRMKIRTDLGESPWSTATIDRGLSTPLINSAVNDSTKLKCTIKTNASRFSSGMLYTLSRTYTDILATNAGSTNLLNLANNLSTSVGSSVYEYDDVGLVDGVTYNYTLSATDQNFYYPMATHTASSAVASCSTKRISVKGSPGSLQCFLSLEDTGEGTTTFNPYVIYEWGYMTTGSGWIGTGDNDGKTNSGYSLTSCGNSAVCTVTGLTAGVTYYFALRSKSAGGIIGKWSIPIACKPN